MIPGDDVRESAAGPSGECYDALWAIVDAEDRADESVQMFAGSHEAAARPSRSAG